MLFLTKPILVLLTCLLMSCNSKQLGAQSRPEPSVTPTVLPTPDRLDTEDFEIEPGPGWKMESEGESYLFNDEQNLRQIAIAVLRPTTAAEKIDIQQLGLKAIEFRQDAMRQMSDGKVEISSTKVLKVRDGYDLTFSAYDPVNKVKVRSTTFARRTRVVTVSFIKYSPFPTDEDLDRQFAQILSRLKLKN